MLQLVTKDETLPVSLADVKDAIDVETTEHDDYLTLLLKAALEDVERETDCDFYQKTWDHIIPRFPEGRIDLPRSPVNSITSITYYDVEGNQQTLSSDNYHAVFPSNMPGWIEIAQGEVWPATRLRPDAVTVRFTSGYTTTPDTLKQLVKLKVKMWFDGVESSSLERTIKALTDQLKVTPYA